MMKKIIIVGTVIALFIVFYAAGLGDFLTLSYLKGSRDNLRLIYAERPIAFTVSYCAVYLAAVSLNLPGAIVLSLAGGAFFGFARGVLIVSFTSSAGATLACFLSRTVFREIIARRFPAAIEKINRGIDREGGFFLFFLRLIPLFPFFITNMAMGLTMMPLRKFYLISQAGMLPATAVFVYAGSELGKVNSISDIFTPEIFISLALGGIVPIMAKTLYRILRPSSDSPEVKKKNTFFQKSNKD